MVLHETEKFLQGKRHCQIVQTAACIMGKDIHQSHIGQRVDFQNILRTQETRHQNTK